MGADLATRAELVKLARALGTTADGVEFAASLAAGDIRRLREQVVGALYDEHRAAFRRVAAITRTLPTALNVRIALRAFSPLLAARIASEMPPERAAELANRMPVDYLAECCVHLDPRRAEPLLTRIDNARVVAVVSELIRRGDFITLGRLLDAATGEMLSDISTTVADESLLRIALYAESGAQLTRAMQALPAERLRAVVHSALTGTPDVRAAALAVVSRVEDDELRGALAAYAAELDDATLTALLHTAVAEDAVTELLTAVAAMPEPARKRVLALPALHDPAFRPRFAEHELWHHVSLIDH